MANAPSTSTNKTKKATTKKKTSTKPKKPRKKTAKKETVDAATLLENAKLAQADQRLQKQIAQNRRTDPLWYRMEDVLDDSNVAPSSLLPEQLSVVENSLKMAGLTRSDVTPQAMNMLCETAVTFTKELLLHAQDYAHSAHRTECNRDDLTLSRDLVLDAHHNSLTFAQVPKLTLIAQQINRVPLPPIPSTHYGVVLPRNHRLQPTYDVLLSSLSTSQQQAPLPSPKSSKKRKKSSSSSSSQVGYGASRGRQIPIALHNNNNKTTTEPAAMDTSK